MGLLIFYWIFSALFTFPYFSIKYSLEEKNVSLLLFIESIIFGGFLFPIILGIYVSVKINKL